PDGDQHRHHDERVRPAEGEADDPHRSTYGPSVRMIRGIASSSLIATAVPLRTRELGDPEAARPWNTPGRERAAGWTADDLCADRSARVPRIRQASSRPCPAIGFLQGPGYVTWRPRSKRPAVRHEEARRRSSNVGDPSRGRGREGGLLSRLAV